MFKSDSTSTQKSDSQDITIGDIPASETSDPKQLVLSEETKRIVKETASLLREKGVDVTKRMYELMFSESPQVKPLFNQANQVSARQPTALANAVAAYAENIDNIPALAEPLALMAHKHASLGVEPEHYPTVGKHLLQAIRDVLNPPEAVMTAWGEAYEFLAQALIKMEHDLYQQAASKQGGWEKFRQFTVDKIVPEAKGINSFYLKPEDGKPLPEYKPGQYITVRVHLPTGETTMRNYTLSDAPNSGYFRITVKEEPRPEGMDVVVPEGIVSHYLHGLKVGEKLELRPPMGNFYWLSTQASSRPMVLISGGVGITPLLSILNTVLESGSARDVYFIHSTKNEQTHVMKEPVSSLAEKYPNLHIKTAYTQSEANAKSLGLCDRQGRIDEEWLQSILPTKDCDYYFCGPVGFALMLQHILRNWQVPASQIHHEVFGPALAEAPAPGESGVHFSAATQRKTADAPEIEKSVEKNTLGH